MMKELGIETPIELYNDNSGCIQLSRNGGFHKRTKHIDLKYQFLKDLVRSGRINLRHCSTAVMIADILTKGLNSERTHRLCESMGLIPDQPE